jgi:photosynthetic reaction center cytochrome c subunit
MSAMHPLGASWALRVLRVQRFALLALCMAGLAWLAGCDRTESEQRGFRGLAMMQVNKPATLAAQVNKNYIPEPEPTDPPEEGLPTVDETFENVTVLNDLSVLEFSRLMQAMSTWVAPVEGCDFCHNPDDLASDEKYTKVVARRMLTMTREINTQWKAHVADTGVTCWTCHRGEAVPSGDWFKSPGDHNAAGMVGSKRGQNRAGVREVGNSALPFDPMSQYLTTGNEIRVQGKQPLRNGHGESIRDAEWTYALMMYMSNSLGVNCTYCHNSRALARWDESTPQRGTAWHGIRLVRDLNTRYLIPMQPLFPLHRLSPEGDGPKVGCETCHKQSGKPLNGVTMLNDYPELRGVMAARPPMAPAQTSKAPMATPQ